MLDKREIEKRLQGVPVPLIAAYAARCALRMLPLLAQQANHPSDVFAYWDESERPKHLLSTFRALHVSVAFSALSGKENHFRVNADAANDANDAANAAANDAANAARAAYAAANAAVNAAVNAVNAVNAATYTANAADAADAADAAYAYTTYTTYAAYAAYADVDAAIAVTEADLDFISSRNSEDSPAFLATPLWPHGALPDSFEPYWQSFQSGVRALNGGFEVWLSWYEQRVRGEPLDLTSMKKLLKISDAVLAQGPKAYNEQVRRLLVSTDSNPLNQVRLIFIGNGEAGKTSLIRRLNGEPVVEGKEAMTPGIEIRHWPVGDTGLTAKTWDFGGQVVGHSTHQFFLREDCVYVLVLNGRSELNANDQAEYWLEHVKAFGKSAPVMLVGNKDDLMPSHLDMNALKEKYDNIVAIYPLSCTSQQDKYQRLFQNFKEALIEQLHQAKICKIMFSPAEFKVLDDLQQRSCRQAILSQDEFDVLYNTHVVDPADGLSKKDLLGILDKLGEVVHFEDLEHLGKYVLNPRWLTYGVYTLLYSEAINEARSVN